MGNRWARETFPTYGMEEIAARYVVPSVMGTSTESIRNEMAALLPRLRRFAASLTGNINDADDLVQDTVERALRALSQWQAGTRLDSWMFRIAQNLWIDQLRARRVRAFAAHDPDAAENVSIDGRREVEARLDLADAVRALSQLPDEQRIAVALVFVDGMSYREAAETLQVPIGTVTSRLARARSALEAHMLGEKKAVG